MSEAPQRRYGVADHEEIAELDGRQILQAMIDGKLPTPPMAKTLAFDLVEVGEGFAAFEGRPDETFLNPMGVVHGGWALTLVDSAAGCAAMTLLPVGAGYTTIETKVNFSRPILADTGKVRAESRIVSRGARILSAEARVVDATGRVLAHGTSTLMVLGEGRAARRS